MKKKQAALFATLILLISFFANRGYYAKAQNYQLISSKKQDLVQANRISFIESINVIKIHETKYANIKQYPSRKSRIVGITYGNLTGINILKKSGLYAYVEALNYKTDKLIKGYILFSQLKKVTPKKPYHVIIDLSDQKVYVYKDEYIEKEMLCSSGIDGSKTPIGTYLIGERGSSFYSAKYKQGAYNWVRFNNNFLFHSVPFDTNKRIIPEEEQKLGQQASHGCIRLAMEDSKWFYKTIPAGTAVVVQE